MKRRITISLEADLERKIRNKQASLLLKSNHSVSFSEMLNRILGEALKKEELEVEPESESKAKHNPSLIIKAKRNRVNPKMVNSVQSKANTKKNVELESKLNSIYNRLV